METYRFRKTRYFYLSFHSNSRTDYSFYWKTNFIETALFLLTEQIFWLVEISFRSRLLLCVATDTLSCTNMLLL